MIMQPGADDEALPDLSEGQGFEPMLTVPYPSPMPLWSDGEDAVEEDAAEEEADGSTQEGADPLARWWKREPRDTESNTMAFTELLDNSVAPRTLMFSKDIPDVDKSTLTKRRIPDINAKLRLRHTWTTPQVLALCALGLFSLVALLHWGFDHRGAVAFRRARDNEIQMIRESHLVEFKAKVMVSTTAFRSAARGTTEVEVASASGFHVRDEIDLGGLETKFIIGVSHGVYHRGYSRNEGDVSVLILDSPSKYAHFVNSVVTKVGDSSTNSKANPVSLQAARSLRHSENSANVMLKIPRLMR